VEGRRWSPWARESPEEVETVVELPGFGMAPVGHLSYSAVPNMIKEDTAMVGPGVYRPDPTEGITAIADLPPPENVPASRTYTRQACPRCGHQAYRDKQYNGGCTIWAISTSGVHAI